ncbi:hypothetical protein GCM10022226_58590 [Sphaerisporangium flaviroseum]|uniref:Serine/threonine protein kinase n=2 Tax=Sphaerisporangium flaviroseum TaxID=509199 RepID=A0ABP7IYA1_9ACTN
MAEAAKAEAAKERAAKGQASKGQASKGQASKGQASKGQAARAAKGARTSSPDADTYAPFGASGVASDSSAATAHARAAADGTAPPEIEDVEVTANVRRPAGPFLHPDRPVARGDWSSRSPASPAPAPRSGRSRWLASAVMRVGDIPIRAVYGIGAAIVTGIVVVLIFMLFGGDAPSEPVRVDPVQAGGPAATSAAPKPTPIAVPPVPAARAMTVFPGTGTPIAAYTVDRTSGISYAQYGAPWVKTSRDPFAFAQKAGPSKQSQALIGSAPVPVAVRSTPATFADFRKLAAKAAKWTLRYQPAGAKFTWTVSQQARYNPGWLLGYKVSYVQGGKKHSSQAYVMVISTARKKPAMLFANVPDTRKALYRDLNMLFWTARAI